MKKHLIVPDSYGEPLRTVCGRLVRLTGSYERDIALATCGLCQYAVGGRTHPWIEGYHYRPRTAAPTTEQGEMFVGEAEA
ncbi:MAG: hypothetical protein KDC95_14405 [Planctomycetes bacterium]|nr:hypothetical protein [Planctomycetota bacterium]